VVEGSEWYAWYKREGGRQLRGLLMDNWDPIGVRGIPDAIDEYDTYAGRIADSLRRGADVEMVSAMLGVIRVGGMGLGPDPGTDASAALAIVDWYADAMRVDGDLTR
jgi:hypothetical protein